jgi:hypothetical protein
VNAFICARCAYCKRFLQRRVEVHSLLGFLEISLGSHIQDPGLQGPLEHSRGGLHVSQSSPAIAQLVGSREIAGVVIASGPTRDDVFHGERPFGNLAAAPYAASPSGLQDLLPQSLSEE